MVCIAAFIILCLVSVFVGFLSIFNRKLGKKYWSVFQKAWHCVFKKVRLQKCDTNFKDDVKNTLLKRIVIKQPKLLKPLSILIEVFSVIIVFITLWSIAISVKSLLALWVFGTCNVSQPSQCGLGSEICSIDQVEPIDPLGKIGRSISEWGEIFSAIPDRLKTWDAKDYFSQGSIPIVDFSHEIDMDALIDLKKSDNNSSNHSDDPSKHPNEPGLLDRTKIPKTPENLELVKKFDENTLKLLRFYQNHTLPENAKTAVDFLDPGCVVCMQSYRNQKRIDFFKEYFTIANLYAIPKPEGGYKFENSKLITDYLSSVIFLLKNRLETLSQNQEQKFDFSKMSQEQQLQLANLLRLPARLLDRLYIGSGSEERSYVHLMNYSFDQQTALQELNRWAKEFRIEQSDLELINQVVLKRNPQENEVQKQIMQDLKKLYTDQKTEKKASIKNNSQAGDQADKILNQLILLDEENKKIVTQKLKAKGIPTEIYDNKKHNGLFRL